MCPVPSGLHQEARAEPQPERSPAGGGAPTVEEGWAKHGARLGAQCVQEIMGLPMEGQAVKLKALLTSIREGIGEQARRRSLSEQ